jgi:predicted kinase
MALSTFIKSHKQEFMILTTEDFCHVLQSFRSAHSSIKRVEHLSKNYGIQLLK